MSYIDFIGGSNYIAVNRVLLKSIGVIPAILYCELVDKHKYYKKEGKLDEEGMFYNTVETTEENTGLTRNQQVSGLRELSLDGLIIVKKKGIPAKRYIKVVEDDSILKKYLGIKDEESKDEENEKNKSTENQTTCEKQYSEHKKRSLVTQNQSTSQHKTCQKLQ